MNDLFKVPDDVYVFFNLDKVKFTKNTVFLVTGSNASGKSLLRRVVSGRAKKKNILSIALSNEKRVTSDISRAFIYGSEEDQSTGEITCHSIMGTIRSSKGYENHILIIDEPEIGLAEEAQLGLANFLVESFSEPIETRKAIFIFSHSRVIMSTLSKIEHTFINLDGLYDTVEKWANRKIVAVSPSDVLDKSHKTYATVQKMINKHKKD